MRKAEFLTKEEWLEARKSCLTGTTVGKYVGIESNYALKTQEQMDKNPAVNFGVSCEESILTIFRHLPAISKQTLVCPTKGYALWYSSKDERIAGSFDALVFEEGMSGFCECKSTSSGLYDLQNMIIPDTTWLQIIHYFCLDDDLQFCYLVVCDYPKWGNGGARIDWIRISRESLMDRITNLQGWHSYILEQGLL